jgi:hypothetical protein
MQRQRISYMKNLNWPQEKGLKVLFCQAGGTIIARAEGEMTRLDIFFQ